MASFSYVVLNPAGRRIRGRATASCLEDLRSDLESKGLLVLELRQDLGLASLLDRRTVSGEALLIWAGEMRSLLRAGIPAAEALELTAERPDCPPLGRAVRDLGRELQGGLHLSQGLAKGSGVFDPLLGAAFALGEKTGDFVRPLESYIANKRRVLAFKTKVGQALTYPVFLVGLSAALLALLFVHVLPRFDALYQGLGGELPAATLALRTISRRLPLLLALAAAAGVLAVSALAVVRRTEEGRRNLDGVLLKMPGLGPLFADQGRARVLRTLSALFSGGSPAAEALASASVAEPNRTLARSLDLARRELLEGRSLASSLESQGLCPGPLARLVAAGERSSQLDQTLAEAALILEDRLERRLSRLTTLAEPVLILATGLMIGAVVIILYLPIFRLASLIQ